MAGPMSTPQAHHPYTIVSQQHGEDLSPAGVFQETWTYVAQGADGTSVTVKVPAAQATAAYVDQLVQEKLDLVDDVAKLGATPHPDNAA